MNRFEKKDYYCNDVIHEEFKNTDKFIICPFCNLQISENQPKKIKFCCKKQNLLNDKGIICNICGIRFNNEYLTPYFDFYENKFKIRKKTIYNRQYHIKNILNSYDIKQLTWNNQDKILKIFVLINGEQRKVNINRKRMISLHYILRRLFKMLNIDYKIPLSKNKDTRKHFRKYWRIVMGLIGEDINNIINKQAIF